ncbi:MAG: GNAT family N-acetyltransferase [Terriglobia bacterium]
MRVATPADTSSIVLVTNAAFEVEAFLDGTRTDEERLAAQMQKGSFLVEEDAAGHILASIYIELRGERGYFGMLAVDPSQQGRGLGRAMAQAAEDHCRQQGCTAIDIAVLSLRPDLLPFYHKLGYFETATEEFHPSRPLKTGAECHLIIMSKML